MTRAARLLPPWALTAALLLAGCAGQQAKTVDKSLGLDEQDSPGDIYVAMAAEYYRLGQLDAAVRRGEQAVAEDPRNPRAFYVMAVIYQGIGQIARAEENFKKAIELSPNNSDIRNAYGSFYCGLGRYGEADVQFQKALENPIYTSPWVAITNAGTCAAAAGNRAKAEGEYRRALGLNPRFGPALVKMADIEYKRGDAKAAKSYLDAYFSSNQPTPGALALGARTERKLGNANAAKTYEQVLQRNFPTAPETREL